MESNNTPTLKRKQPTSPPTRPTLVTPPPKTCKQHKTENMCSVKQSPGLDDESDNPADVTSQDVSDFLQDVQEEETNIGYAITQYPLNGVTLAQQALDEAGITCLGDMSEITKRNTALNAKPQTSHLPDSPIFTLDSATSPIPSAP